MSKGKLLIITSCPPVHLVFLCFTTALSFACFQFHPICLTTTYLTVVTNHNPSERSNPTHNWSMFGSGRWSEAWSHAWAGSHSSRDNSGTVGTHWTHRNKAPGLVPTLYIQSSDTNPAEAFTGSAHAATITHPPSSVTEHGTGSGTDPRRNID